MKHLTGRERWEPGEYSEEETDVVLYGRCEERVRGSRMLLKCECGEELNG